MKQPYERIDSVYDPAIQGWWILWDGVRTNTEPLFDIDDLAREYYATITLLAKTPYGENRVVIQ